MSTIVFCPKLKINKWVTYIIKPIKIMLKIGAQFMALAILEIALFPEWKLVG